MRDLVFISYACEQVALADWLARRLTSAGYGVWMDRLKLGGGEDWPTDIQNAIRKRAGCVLALLSKASSTKRNPQGEWLVALDVSKREDIHDFLIPLKVEEMRAEEIPFTLQTINYIPFTEGWAGGLARVLRRLEDLRLPRIHEGQGPALASVIAEACDAVGPFPEMLFSNLLPVVSRPRLLRRFNSRRRLGWKGSQELALEWPHFRVDDHAVLAFEMPPESANRKFQLDEEGELEWGNGEEINGRPALHIATAIARRSVDIVLKAKRLAFDPERRAWFFPDGILTGNWLKFERADGGAGRLMSVGTVSLGRGVARREVRHHLSPSLGVFIDSGQITAFVLRLRVHITTPDKSPLSLRSYITARKRLCKRWWNEEWLNRALAVSSFLRSTEDDIVLGRERQSSFVLRGKVQQFLAPTRVMEASADALDPDEILERDDTDEDEEV